MKIPKFRFDSDGRMDAPTSLFTSGQLEQIRPEVYSYQYDELIGRSLVPLNTSIDPGAEEYGYEWYDHVGAAKYVTDYGTDFPRVDAKVNKDKAPLHSIGDSYGWSIQELRAAAFANRPLGAARAKAARDAIELLIDDSLTIGDATKGVLGLFSQPISGPNAVVVAVLGTGDAGNGWMADGSQKTPREILADMHAASLNVNVTTRGREAVDSLVLPPSAYGYIATATIDDIGSSTILETFLANDPWIKNVSKHFALETAGAGSTRRAVFYKKDASKLEGLIAQEFEQMPPEYHAMQVVTTCHARIGGVLVYFPKSIAYLDGF